MQSFFFALIQICFITICPFILEARTVDPVCLKWFERSAIAQNGECAVKCSSLKVDMGTFHCPTSCKELCRPTKKKYSKTLSSLYKVLYYPGLTEDEKKLLRTWPRDAYIVYEQKNIAESSTEKYFPDGDFNDESDAFRHFIWAGLLTKELGTKKAQVFLDAHEQDPKQPENEKAMDLANNRGGLLAALHLKEQSKLDLTHLEKEALSELRQKKLIVLNPRLKVPQEVR